MLLTSNRALRRILLLYDTLLYRLRKTLRLWVALLLLLHRISLCLCLLWSVSLRHRVTTLHLCWLHAGVTLLLLLWVALCLRVALLWLKHLLLLPRSHRPSVCVVVLLGTATTTTTTTTTSILEVAYHSTGKDAHEGTKYEESKRELPFLGRGHTKAAGSELVRCAHRTVYRLDLIRTC